MQRRRWRKTAAAASASTPATQASPGATASPTVTTAAKANSDIALQLLTGTAPTTA